MPDGIRSTSALITLLVTRNGAGHREPRSPRQPPSSFCAVPGSLGRAYGRNVYADDEAWDTQGSPSDGDGKNVFDRAKRAAEQLLGVDNPPPSLATAIDELVSISGTMAQARIDAAVADGGSQSKINDALEHMARALEKLANGEPHKAIDEYKKAWEKARDAL